MGSSLLFHASTFPRGGHFCAPLSELCQETVARLMRNETDPDLVAGFTRALCVSNQRKHPFVSLRTRKAG